VVKTLARLFERIMGIGGAVALCSVANPTAAVVGILL
jgi:hypothetical protein